MKFKLGRRSPLFTPRMMRVALHMNDVFASFGPPPPASQDFMPQVQAAGGFQIYLNDVLGCCTASDCGNGTIWRSCAAGNPLVPTDAEILAIYEATGGYKPKNPSNPQTNATDQGAMESTVCDYMVSTGISGHKAEATATIVTGAMDSGALDRLRWGIVVFGGVRIGVNLPAAAESQTDAQEPWSLSGDQTVVGGHDVYLTNYDSNYFYCATWGLHQPIEESWLTKFCEEGHVEAWPLFIRPSGWTPTGFRDATLIRDLQAMAVA